MSSDKDKEDIKRQSVRKAKARTFKREKELEKFISDFQNTEHALSKKQERDLPRKAQHGLPLEKKLSNKGHRHKRMSEEEFSKWRSERNWYHHEKYPPLSEIESPTKEETDRVFAESNKKLRDSLEELEDSGKVEKEYINGVAVYFRKRTR